MIYIQRLIKMLSLIGINVNQDRTTDKARTSRDRKAQQEYRASKGSAIQAGTNRRSIRQEKHGGTSCYSSKSLFRQLYEKVPYCQHRKGTIGEKEQAKRTKGRSANSKCSIIYPSFLFSYNFLLLLQSIDDICLHLNPYLLSQIIQTSPYIVVGV